MLATVATSRTDDVMAAAAAPAALPSALTEGFQRRLHGRRGFALLGAVLAIVLISGVQPRVNARRRSCGQVEEVPVAA